MSKYPKNGSPKNEVLGLKRSFFDFRGMILALLAVDNIPGILYIHRQSPAITASNKNVVKWDETRFKLPPRPRIKKLPSILNEEEVKRQFDAAVTYEHQNLSPKRYRFLCLQNIGDREFEFHFPRNYTIKDLGNILNPF